MARGRSIATIQTNFSADTSSARSAEGAVVQAAYREIMAPSATRAPTQNRDIRRPRRVPTSATTIMSPTTPRFKVVNGPSSAGSEDSFSAPATRRGTTSQEIKAREATPISLLLSTEAQDRYRRDTLEVELASLEYELRSPDSTRNPFGAAEPSSDGHRDTMSTNFPDPRDYSEVPPPRPFTNRRSMRNTRDRLSTVTSVTNLSVISDLSFMRAPRLDPPLPYPTPAEAFATSSSEDSDSEPSSPPSLPVRRPPPPAAGAPSAFVKKPSMAPKMSPPREGGTVRGPRAPKSAVAPIFDEEELEIPTYSGKGKGRKRSSSIG